MGRPPRTGCLLLAPCCSQDCLILFFFFFVVVFFYFPCCALPGVREKAVYVTSNHPHMRGSVGHRSPGMCWAVPCCTWAPHCVSPLPGLSAGCLSPKNVRQFVTNLTIESSKMYWSPFNFLLGFWAPKDAFKMIFAGFTMQPRKTENFLFWDKGDSYTIAWCIDLVLKEKKHNSGRM